MSNMKPVKQSIEIVISSNYNWVLFSKTSKTFCIKRRPPCIQNAINSRCLRVSLKIDIRQYPDRIFDASGKRRGAGGGARGLPFGTGDVGAASLAKLGHT